MQAEIISTGDEVLTGFITDTNAPWLSQELLSLGVYTYRRHTVSDNVDDIADILEQRSREADVLLVNGGLGPTSDDNTSVAAAKAAGEELVLNEVWLEEIRKWHSGRNRTMPKTNIKQAMIPRSATMIPNPCGTACGFHLKINKAVCFFTPGVPVEFKGMYLDYIRPYIKEHLLKDSEYRVKRIFLFGIPESRLGQQVEQIDLDPSITVGYRAAYPVMELKLIEHKTPQDKSDYALGRIREICRPYLICEDEFNLPWRISGHMGGDSMCLLDNVTRGMLGVDLSSDVNLRCVLVTGDRIDVSGIDPSLTGDSRFVMAVYDNDRQGMVHFYLNDRQEGKVREVGYRLNITIKERKGETLSLIAQSFVLNTLENRELILPDNCEFVRV